MRATVYIISTLHHSYLAPHTKGQDGELGKGNLACFTEVGDVVLHSLGVFSMCLIGIPIVVPYDGA